MRSKIWKKLGKKIKNYTLENNAAAQENFIVGSLQLDGLRTEKREVTEFLSVLEILKELTQTSNLDMETYEALRVSSPLVDDVDFRRILGMRKTISAWNWPTLETIKNVGETLRDRVRRLDVEIANIEESAVAYAASAEDQAKLLRDAKIAEATVTVLTEQVKSQTLVTGFKPDTFRVFAFASPPLVPSSPKRNFSLVIGFVLGLFIGSTIALIVGKRKNVFYTRSSIISQAQPINTLQTSPIRRLARLSGAKLLSALDKNQPADLEEANAILANNKLIFIISYNGKPSASQVANLLTTQSFRSGRQTLLIDTNKISRKQDNEISTKNIDGVGIDISEEGFDRVTEHNDVPFLTSNTLEGQLNSLACYEQIVICSEGEKSIAGLIALKSFKPGPRCSFKDKKNEKKYD